MLDDYSHKEAGICIGIESQMRIWTEWREFGQN